MPLHLEYTICPFLTYPGNRQRWFYVYTRFTTTLCYS